jgi:hypothetical protein
VLGLRFESYGASVFITYKEPPPAQRSSTRSTSQIIVSLEFVRKEYSSQVERISLVVAQSSSHSIFLGRNHTTTSFFHHPHNTTKASIKMSNAQVGNVYQQIIADVIESSRVDFEEGGVEEGVLEELRLVSLPAFPFVALLFPSVASNTFLHHLLRVILFTFRCLRALSSVEDIGVDDSSYGCEGLLPRCAVAPASNFRGWAPLCIWLYTQPFACKSQSRR